MACGCESFICVEGFFNPCSEGMQLPIVSDYTGNMTGKVWFNGVVSTFGVGVTEGENIVVPTANFNESYIHEMRLYNVSGDQVACYKVQTITDLQSGTHPVPPIIETFMQGQSYTGNGTDTQEFDDLGTLTGYYTLLTIAMGGQEYTSDFFTQTGNIITLSGGMIFSGTIVLNWI